MYTRIIFSFITVFLFSLFTTTAQNVLVNGMNVTNPPATDCAPVTLTVSGVNDATNYIFNGTPHTISGNTITINVEYLIGFVVFPGTTPFSHNVNVGNLSVGTYTVVVNGFLSGQLNSTHTDSFSVVVCCPAQASFTVNTQDTICLGDTVSTNNTSIGVVNYAWYQGGSLISNDTNVTVPFNTPGLHALKLVVDDGNCSDSSEIVFSVNSQPVINLGNDTAICAGDQLLLDPGQGFVNYSWSDGDTTATNVLDTIGVMMVTVTDFAGCVVADTLSVTNMIPLAPVNLGNDIQVCPSATATLDAGNGWTSYQWSNGATSQTITVSSGIYGVTVSNNNFCPGSDTIVVSEYNVMLLDLGADSSSCGPAMLSSAAGYDTYLWSTGETTSTITVNVSGTYALTVTDSNNCSQTDDITFIIYDQPVVALGADTTICEGDDLLLIPQGDQGTYLWQDNSTDSSFLVTQAGTYWVEVTDTNGCVSSDSIAVAVEICGGFAETSLPANVKIYPSPASQRLMVEAPGISVSAIQLLNTTGQLVASSEFMEKERYQLDVSSLPSGIYFLRIEHPSGAWVHRVLKR